MVDTLFLPLGLGLLRGTPVSTDIPYLSGSAYAILALLAGSLLHLFPITNLPAPSGPFIVGMRTFEMTDETRKGLFGVGENDPRRLLVRVWYPAEGTGGGKPAPYFNALEAKSTARGLGDLAGVGFLNVYQRHAKTNSYVDAPNLVEAESLPTILFSHGAFGQL